MPIAASAKVDATRCSLSRRRSSAPVRSQNRPIAWESARNASVTGGSGGHSKDRIPQRLCPDRMGRTSAGTAGFHAPDSDPEFSSSAVSASIQTGSSASQEGGVESGCAVNERERVLFGQLASSTSFPEGSSTRRNVPPRQSSASQTAWIQSSSPRTDSSAANRIRVIWRSRCSCQERLPRTLTPSGEPAPTGRSAASFTLPWRPLIEAPLYKPWLVSKPTALCGQAV